MSYCQFYSVLPHAERTIDMKIPLRFLGRLSSRLLNYFPPSLPPTNHHIALHATVRSHKRENDTEVRSRTIHWRYNLITQFMTAVYCHVLVAESGRETFARLLRGRHLSDNENFISIDPISLVPVFLHPPLRLPARHRSESVMAFALRNKLWLPMRMEES
jgi:hypothetical protein